MTLSQAQALKSVPHFNSRTVRLPVAELSRDRYRGCLLGLAAGDALGTTVEFKPPGSFTPLDDIVGGGPFGLQPGQWTDDTSMALCLAESIVETGWDAGDQMRRYVRWYRKGYLSSTETCFDIGNVTREALHQFEETSDPLAGMDREKVRVRVPHQVIWGMQDKALLPASRHGLANLCDNLTVHEIPDADHWIIHQKPAEVTAFVAEFLAKHNGRVVEASA